MVRRKESTFEDLLASFSNGLERVALRPDVNSYKPHDKQIRFHQSGSKGRLYIGGNRSGKTVAGIVECIWWLTHTHPYRVTPEGPIRGRLVCVDFPNGWEKIVKPVLTQWIPPSALINGSWDDSFDKRYRTLHLANGSQLEIMSYDQEVTAFAGASLHFVMFDEEPPQPIWEENRMRVLDTAGSMWISMTPVEGLEWIEDDIYEPFQKHGLNTPFKYDVIEVDSSENPYLPQDEVNEVFSGMDEEELKIRKQGKFSRPGGLIYKHFNTSSENGHVIPSLKSLVQKRGFPRNWFIAASMDHGFNNATSWHWHLIRPDGTVITFAEHYRSHWTVKQHAERVKEIEQEWGIADLVQFRVGDPAIAQKSGLGNKNGGTSVQIEYRQGGIPIILGNNDVKVGITKVNEYHRQNKHLITADCPKMIWEIRKYRWKTRASKKLQDKMGPMDEPHKKDDHAMDDLRYFMSFRPDLTPKAIPIDLSRERNQIQSMLNGVVGFRVDLGRRDYFRAKPKPRRNAISSTDEHMGGVW